MDTIAESFCQVLQRVGAQEFAAAESLCGRILEEEPEHADTLNLLFVIGHQTGAFDGILGLLTRVTEQNPDSAVLHLNRAMMLRMAGDFEQSIDCCKRALEIRPDYGAAHIELGELLHEIEGKSAAGDATPALSLGTDSVFTEFDCHSGGMVLIGTCTRQKYFAKIELFHHPNKSNTLEQEAKIMAHLNERGCVSCPQAYAYGTIGAEDLLPYLDEEQKIIVRAVGKDDFPFIVQDYVKTGTNLNLADMILSMIEQKSLGVYHADPRPDNLRIDEDSGICYLIDYDQAEFLDEDTMNMDNSSFFKWCDNRAKEKYGFSTFLNYFPNLSFDEHFMRYFRDGSFNIGTTTIFSRQQTTLAQCGIYHSLRGETIFSDGERDISDRRKLLDAVTFEPGERLLDVGCNAGLVSVYLHDRGCRVTGIDLDRSIIYGARFVANILRKDIRYGCVDLDVDELPGEFDTVTLFSVLHHTRNVAENAARIAASCRRILIECRLKEVGAKPEDGVWSATSTWQYETVADLIAGLERLFPGFKLATNHGQGDRERFLLEFVKR